MYICSYYHNQPAEAMFPISYEILGCEEFCINSNMNAITKPFQGA